MGPASIFDRWCKFQVIDPAVARILSRVGPTIRRGKTFVSYCTTVVVCIPRRLPVLVSLTSKAAPPLPNICEKKVNTAVGYWYLQLKANSTFTTNPNTTKTLPDLRKYATFLTN